MKFKAKNTVSSTVSNRKDATTNFEGGIAFTMSPKLELFLRTASAMIGEPKFYTDGKKSDVELVDLVKKVSETDPEFVYKLALYTRDKLYLRSVPILLLTELANTEYGRGVPNARKWVASTIQRPDEITEMLAYQFKINELTGKSRAFLPMVLKYGMKSAFTKFSAYHLGKYQSNGTTMNLKDAVCLVHPAPVSDDQEEIFEKIVNRKLSNESWETALMKGGSTKENWENEIPTMGYMALIRNLNNFLKTGVDPDLYMSRITDEDFVKKSKQFPYRFYTAWKMVKENSRPENPSDVREVLKGLEKALKMSVGNVPELPGITFTAVDVSGSMDAKVSEKSIVSRADVSSLFGAIMNEKSHRSIVSAFGQDFAVVPMDSESILKNMEAVKNTHVGHSTNGWKAIDYLNRENIVVDRIVTFSDEVMYDSSSRFSFFNVNPRQYVEELVKYQRNVNPDVYIYSVDLAGYGFSSVPENAKNTVKVAGFSDKIFNYISLFETDHRTMLNDIENYTYH